VRFCTYHQWQRRLTVVLQIFESCPDRKLKAEEFFAGATYAAAAAAAAFVFFAFELEQGKLSGDRHRLWYSRRRDVKAVNSDAFLCCSLP
jgi:hypothetical protein